MSALSDPLLAAINIHHAPSPKFWFWIVEERGPVPEKFILISDIQRAVARHFELTPQDLISDCRSKREVLPRHIAMYLCKTLTLRSYDMIARLFNRTDHSVSRYAFAKISRLIKTDSEVADDVAQITRALA